MRLAATGLALFAAGLVSGYVLFGGESAAPRAGTRPPAVTQEPAPPEPPGIARAEAPAQPATNEREQWEALKRNLFEEIRKREQRIHDLLSELDVARKTLPEPAILQDLDRATPQELLDLVQAIGRVGERKLLVVPEEVKLRYAALLGLEDAGAARIVERGKYDAIVQQVTTGVPATKSTSGVAMPPKGGAPLTDAAKWTERFRRVNYGSLEIEITVDDPKAYTKPWTVKIDQSVMLDTDLIEFVCAENEKSTHHF